MPMVIRHNSSRTTTITMETNMTYIQLGLADNANGRNNTISWKELIITSLILVNTGLCRQWSTIYVTIITTIVKTR